MPTWTESLHALLEDGALPAKLEDLRTPLLATIEGLSQELASSYARTSRAVVQQNQLLMDGSQTLAIMGERGSGKSTLLAAVTGALVNEGRHLVVPVMRPELFGETDSVITTFLAELWDMVVEEAKGADGEPTEWGREALKLLLDTARGFAVARTTTAALEQGTDNPGDFAEDFLTVSRSQVRLVRQLRALARALCMREGHADGHRLIIVPIDDPDLAPQSPVTLLTDLQLLGAVPGIVPLTCFSPTDLNDGWIAARRNLLPSSSEEHLQFLLARQLEKVFPYRCRFEIEPVGPSYRADFAPIPREVPLREKLASLRARVERITGATWAFDEALTDGSQRFGLPNPLPDNPRTLVQLWETLDTLEADADTATIEMVHLTLRRMLAILSERVAARLSTTTSALTQIGPPNPDEPTRRPLRSDLTRVEFFIRAVGATQEPDEPAVSFFHLRAMHSVQATAPTGERPRGAERKPEDYLPGDIIAAMLTMQEISFGSGLFDVDGSRLFVGSEEWRFLQSVQLANQTTDDMFLLLPEATTLSEVVRAASLWNEFAALSDGLTAEELLATCARAACLTVERDEQLEVARDYMQTFERACEIYADCQTRGGNTARAFVAWFENHLPLQWHSALVNGDRIRELAKAHRELRKSRSSGPSTAEASLFERRLGVLLDAAENTTDDEGANYTWVAGYFELASAFGSEHLDRLSQVYPKWQRDFAGVRAGAATAGVVTQVRSRVKVAPYATPEGTELLAAAIAALRRKRASARDELRPL